MSDYRVLINRSPRVIRQRFHVTIVASNGKTLFWSENYKNKAHAMDLAERMAGMLDGNLIDLAG